MTTVTPIGARRRITALAWLGWSPPALAAVTGLPERVFQFFPHQFERECGQEVLDRIGASYDLLWDTTPPTLTAEQQAQADAAAQHARKVGYAPPLAYDDDLIDTPDGGPVPGWKRSKSERPRDGAGVIEDIDFLRTVGYRQANPAELGDRLGRSKEAIGRALARHRQVQRQAAASQPDRSNQDWEATA
jgi:hypothetical protein